VAAQQLFGQSESEQHRWLCRHGCAAASVAASTLWLTCGVAGGSCSCERKNIPYVVPLGGWGQMDCKLWCL